MLYRLALASAAALSLAACASGPRQVAYAEPVQIGPAPLPFDPAPLPPNSAPGDCVVRTAGGWDRCDTGYAPAYAYSDQGYSHGASSYSYQAGSGYNSSTLNGVSVASGYAYGPGYNYAYGPTYYEGGPNYYVGGPSYDNAGYDSRVSSSYDRYGSGVGSTFGFGHGGVGYGAGYGYGSAYGAGYGSTYGAYGSSDGRGYASGYGYGAPYGGYGYGYRTAGRDADGYLVWPGKTPRW